MVRSSKPDARYYGLRPGLHYAEVGDRLLFLDIVADRYFLLEASAEAELRDIAAVREDSCAVASRLADTGLLVPTSRHGTITSCQTPPVASSSLTGARATDVALWPAMRAVVTFQASLIRLRWRTLANNLASLPPLPAGCNDSGGATAMVRIAGAFERARRLVSAQDRCLAHSLAVARYARRVGVPVRVVFGVALGPFQAHCWAQSGTTVVNDRVDMVSRFTPILVL